MTRAVLFDVDGVLAHSRFHPNEGQRRFWDEHMLTDMGVDPAKMQPFFKGAFFDVVTGKRSLVSALDEYLPTIGYSGTTLDFVSYWLERDSHINFQLLDAIKRLRATGDLRIYVATNQEHMRAHHLWRDLGLGHVFDDMLYAARLGAMKPDPVFYERASAFLTPGDEPPLLFDDSVDVVRTANEFGWEAVLFNQLSDFTTHPWVAARLTRAA